jgi:hypothetical protein
LFRELSLAFGWTPDEIARVTLEQLSWYTGEDTEPKSRWLSPTDASEYRKQRRAARDAWIRTTWENLERGLSTT